MAEPNPARPLDGRVAVVTGSGRNIGRAIALRLAADGAAVVVNARSNQAEMDEVIAEIKAQGGRAAGCLTDVADEAGVQRLIDTAVDSFGGLDILVNNAAVRHEGPLEEITLADWHHILGIILDGSFLCARAAAPHLKRSPAGTIVNIGGMTGGSGAADRVHVVTGKAGLEGLTKALAWDLAPHDVTVNLIHPGMVDTSRGSSSSKAVPGHHKDRRTLLGRLGTSEEIAGMVAAFCGPDGRYTTGQVLHVNGGTYLR
ncbi:SDR family NAD(P)-dependent oxidoreductase [Alkalilacustris brevis]|uniref:SDR family NAD(P)-dependent oxidoreductase n=1 Tax=Alkalilacustris brevis TaxID=2026338 RepID=UPI000E0CCD71|nr:SDR family oxidoreductase [Alkalilacustris brevis]